MTKLLNLGLAAVMAATFSAGAVAQEDSAVTTNWKNMGRELGRGMANVGRMSADEMVETFNAIRGNMVANADLVPDVLADADEAALAEWKNDVMYSLGMFDAAIAAAEEGEAEAAAAIMAAFDDLRGDMHEKYGI